MQLAPIRTVQRLLLGISLAVVMSAGLPAVAWGIAVSSPAAAPSISSGPAASSYSNSTSATFQFSSSTSGASFTCQLDTGTAASCTSGKQYTSLSEGQHTFKVYATKSGYTQSSTTQVSWTVDTTAPATATVNLDTGTNQLALIDGASDSYDPSYMYPARFSTQSSFAVTYSGETGASFKCFSFSTADNGVPNGAAGKSNIANYSTCGASPLTISMATDGQYLLCIIQVDAAGNAAASPNCLTVVRDTVAPSPVSIVATNDSKTVSSGFATNNASKLKIMPTTTELTPTSFYRSVNAGSYAKLNSSSASDIQSTGLIAVYIATGSEATWNFSFKACDLAGNCSDPRSFSFSIDKTAPSAPGFTSLPGSYQPGTTGRGAVNSTSATFELQLMEQSGTVECRLDSGSWGPCTSRTSSGIGGDVYVTFTPTGLSEGVHTVSARQTDAAGNVGAIATSLSWTVDVTAPAAPASIKGFFEAWEKTDSNGVPIVSGDVSYKATLAEPVTVNYPDTTASRFQCRVDSGTWGSCLGWDGQPVNVLAGTTTFTYRDGTLPKGLSDGPHSVSVRQIDAAGNVGAAKTQNFILYTATPPAPNAFTGVPTSDTSDLSATIGFTVPATYGADYDSEVYCKLDSGRWNYCTSFDAATSKGSFKVASLALGAHTLSVGYYLIGQWSDQAAVTWKVVAAGDTTAPAAPSQFTGVPSAPTNSTSATIGFTLDESGGTVECKLDAGSWAACTSVSGTSGSKALSGLADGSHVLSVRQTDAAGNVSAAGSTTSWVVDTTAPAAPVLNGAPSGVTTSTGESIGFTGESGASFTCSVDGGTYGACGSSPKVLSSLSDGVHTFAVKATDQAGNTSDAKTASWTVDTVAPDAPALSGAPSGSVTSTTASIGFTGEAGATFTCSIDGGSYSSCSSPKALSGLSLGDHSISVKATDATGNTSSAATASWTVVSPVVPTAIAPPTVLTAASGTKTLYKSGSKWAIKVGSLFSNGGDNRSGAQLLSVQVAVNSLGQPVSDRPSDSQAKPSSPSYLNGVVAWDSTGEVLRQSLSKPVWVRVGNKAGKWSGWVKLTA